MTAREFDIGNAIFFFFKRFGDKPAAAIWIIVCQMLIGGALAAAAIWLLFPFWGSIFEIAVLEETSSITEAEAGVMLLESLGPAMAYYALLGPLALVFALMFQGAWLRFLVRGEVAPVIPFRLGSDEFRLLGVNILYIVVSFGLVLAGILAVALVGGFSIGIVETTGADGAGALGALLTVALVFAVILAGVFVMVHLASAAGLSFQDRRFRFFESWGATKGVFWPMLLSLIVVAVMAGLIGSTIGGVFQMIGVFALLPVIEPLVEMAEYGSEPTAQEVLSLLRSQLAQPGTIILLTVVGVMAYAVQIVVEAMIHSVGAYNAVRFRGGDDAGGAVEAAPVLGSDSPLGAAPSEG